MSEYELLREDMAELGKAIGGYQSTSISHLLEQSRQIDRLWTDNAALRDELHAVANRVEGLVRAVTANPADVAAKIVNETNRATLREVREGECSICGGTGQAPGLHAACSICEGTGKRLT